MKHPLHPALVHFPIACWSLATIADGASLRFGEPAWQFATNLMAIGLATATVAMTAGLLDYIRLGDAHPAEADANRHMGWALAAFSCYTASLFLRVRGVQPIAPGGTALALSALGFGCLGVAGWLGGKLVYTHRVGTNESG